MITSVNANNKRYNLEDDGTIYFYDFNKSGDPSIVQWLDLLPPQQQLILDDLRSQGEQVYQAGTKAIETRKVLDIINPPRRETITEGRKLPYEPRSYEVSPLPHDPSATRW